MNSLLRELRGFNVNQIFIHQGFAHSENGDATRTRQETVSSTTLHATNKTSKQFATNMFIFFNNNIIHNPYTLWLA